MRLLGLLLAADRGTVHPQGAESQPPDNCRCDTGDPGPRSADDEAAGPLVVGHVADRDCVLLLDVGQEGTFVVDLEVEDAVLVGDLEGDGVCRFFGGGVGGVKGERETVEGGEHGEFELELVVGGDFEG